MVGEKQHKRVVFHLTSVLTKIWKSKLIKYMTNRLHINSLAVVTISDERKLIWITNIQWVIVITDPLLKEKGHYRVSTIIRNLNLIIISRNWSTHEVHNRQGYKVIDFRNIQKESSFPWILRFQASLIYLRLVAELPLPKVPQRAPTPSSCHQPLQHPQPTVMQAPHANIFLKIGWRNAKRNNRMTKKSMPLLPQKVASMELCPTRFLIRSDRSLQQHTPLAPTEVITIEVI